MIIRFRMLTAITALLVAHAPGLVAQTGVPAGCTYATCALRLEPVFLGVALMHGASGDSATRLGGFGAGVETLLAGPDSAAAFGRRYVQASKTSSALGLVGVAAHVFVAVRTHNFRDKASDTELAVGLAGISFVLASIPFTIKAQRNLSRAIWWYNSALPR